jgi:ComF family protein
MLQWVLRWLGELVAPSGCAACDLRTSLLFCDGCAATVEPAGGEGAFVYGGAIADAILRLKYGRRSDLASRLGQAMSERAPRDVDMVVPVPLHAVRAAERGFNQSALLARPIARHLGVPLGARILERIRDTPRQASLDRVRRQMNVDAAFRCRDARAVAGKRVLLVDDVRTTGATLAECRAALEAAGARGISLYVLAVRDELPEFRGVGLSSR